MGKRYTKRPDGYYQTTVWDGTYDERGVKKRKTIYGKTVKELEEKKREIETNIKNGNVIKSDGEDFLSLCGKWFREEKGTSSGNTKRMYRGVIERYFQSFSSVKPENISYLEIRRILKESENHPRTQEMIISTLKQIIKYGIREKKIPRTKGEEILECFPVVKYRSKEKRALTPGEKEAIFCVNLKDMDKAFLYILYGCGLRREEAIALETSDFDFAGHVKISKALAILEHGDTEMKAPKSERGNRTLPIPESVRGFVEAYAKSCDGALFPGMNRYKYSTMWRHIKKEIKRLCPDSEGLSAHIFRHNYCSELCYKIPTLSIKNVARLLGDSEQMVLNVYSHLNLEKEPTDEVISETF